MSKKKHKKQTSDKQIEANRRNALLSTGAQTPEGHNRSKFNAMHHNMRGAIGLLPWESEAEFREFSDLYIEEYGPQTAMELKILYQIAEVDWSIDRGKRYLVEAYQQLTCVQEIFGEECKVALYSNRLKKMTGILFKEFYRLRDDRLAGKRPLIRVPQTEEAEAAFQEVVHRTAQSGPSYEPGLPLLPEAGDAYRRHQADVALGTMGSSLPRDMVDYATARHTTVSLNEIPQNPPQRDPGKPPMVVGEDALPEQVAGSQMGSFEQTPNPAGEASYQGTRVGHSPAEIDAIIQDVLSWEASQQEIHGDNA